MPSKRPTEQSRKTVKALAGFNASLELIGDVLGIKPESVQKLYAKELQMGPEHIRVDLRRTLVVEKIKRRMVPPICPSCGGTMKLVRSKIDGKLTASCPRCDSTR
jgi:tRNA(Ile2) C34 agmatinyltransferase TiaS